MQEIESIYVKLKYNEYPIFIGYDILKDINKILSPYIKGKTYIISDENVAPLYLESIKENLNAYSIILPAGEKTKSFKYAEYVLEKILSTGCDRSTTLISLGGGVIGDLTGFCASILERGVNFIQVPTTLLSQTDSSVGGKTAINTAFGKNLIGTFYQPKAVVIDSKTLFSLPKEQILAGYGEIVKYGFILDNNFWEYLKLNGKDVIALKKDTLLYVIKRCCQIKAMVVEEDERELTGKRALLNFGHTFAHAFETESNFTLLHGTAVAIGMIYASKLATLLNLPDYTQEMVLHYNKIGLPTSFPCKSPQNIIDHMIKDKKTTNDELNFVLLQSLGNAQVFKNIDKHLIFSVLKD